MPIFKHGKAKTRFHKLWQHVKSRCYDPNDTGFKYYGKRGIAMSEEWLANGGKAFIEWCESQDPAIGMTLDRQDVNGPYADWNCRFISQADQNRNTRSNVIIVYDDVSYTKCEFLRRFAIVGRSTVFRREKEGMTTVEAALLPNRRKRL